MAQPLAGSLKDRLRRTGLVRTMRILFPLRTFMLRMTNRRPLSDQWGFDRGQPVDRHYIDAFMARCTADIRGRVLEVGAPRYAAQLRTAAVERIDIVDVDPANPEATIIGDLTKPGALPQSAFDCIILTQVLQCLPDPAAALVGAMQALKPGGVLLVTVPVISRIEDAGLGTTWYWMFTPAGVRDMCSRHIPYAQVDVHAYGNLRVAMAFLQGRATDEVPRSALDDNDPRFPIVVTVRAAKPRTA